MKQLLVLLALLVTATAAADFNLTIDSKGVNRDLVWDDVAQEYDVVWVGDIIAQTTDSFYSGKIKHGGWVRHSYVRVDAFDIVEINGFLQRIKVDESNTILLGKPGD